jgi:hypothetical protein
MSFCTFCFRHAAHAFTLREIEGWAINWFSAASDVRRLDAAGNNCSGGLVSIGAEVGIDLGFAWDHDRFAILDITQLRIVEAMKMRAMRSEKTTLRERRERDQ